MSITSCDDFFDVDPDDKLLGKDYPTTATELYSGYMGISAKVQQVADKAIFLEGLRSDFLEPTQNATDEIIDIYSYKEDLTGSELASPVGYYEVVLNANDYISHASKFYKNNKNSMDQATFDALIGGALRYKCWAYIMIAKLYGEAVWLDDPLTEFKDLSKYETLAFEAVLDQCILTLENGIEIDGHTIDGSGNDPDGTFRWTDILNASSSLEWNRFTPPVEALLTELYLLRGNYDKTIENGFAMLRLGAKDSETKASYSITKSEWNGEWLDLFGKFYRTEHIFIFLFDYDRKQTNRLMDYFSNDPSCQYLIRPTQASVDRFSAQKRLDGNVGDQYRGSGRTYTYENGEISFYKYWAARKSADKIFRNDVPITLYRASDIHLWIVEALIYKGRFKEAMGLFEDGMASYYNATTGLFNEPFQDFPITLYQTGSDGSCVGIRGRVSLAKVGDPIVKNSTEETKMEDMRKLIDLVVEETCMESAGEARALFAMLRAARHWGDASFIADKVSAKYPDGQSDEIKSKLQNPSNWFIKYDLKK